jgi:acylphosphatase
MSENARAHAVINGRVQGVFFRLETKQAAQKYGIKGWVKNQIDGTVAAVFEGPKKDVDAILEWCKQGPPHAKVTHVDVAWEDYKGEFDDFDITY